MKIKSIRLQNFKGFKDASLELKPLTVLLGPNSAGKSSFGQAIIAMSKSNVRDKVFSLAYDSNSSVDFGTYLDLVHTGCQGEPVMIEIGLESGTLKFGFGGGNAGKPSTNIKELDLTRIEITEKLEAKSSVITPDTVSLTIADVLPDSGQGLSREKIILTRDNDKVWSVNDKEIVQQYKIFFDGADIEAISHETGTAVAPREVLPVIPFQDLGSLLKKVSYLRPDRVPPKREDPLLSNVPIIDDWGRGVPWYIQKFGDTTYVDSFTFPRPASDTIKAQDIISQIASRHIEKKSLRQTVSDWLANFGLAASFETKLIDEGRAVQALATPPGQLVARSLTDVGFGISQVIPILVKGLLLPENGLLIVEQPEAQLHPKPQAELADFFCSMIKCGRNVLVETHSEALFHRLRILAAMDDELAKKMAIYFIDAPQDGGGSLSPCSCPREISLAPGAEFEWPTGFLADGVETEMQVRATRLAKKRSICVDSSSS